MSEPQSFWAMGGYAFHVWSSFGFTAAVFAWNLWAPGARRRQVARQIEEEAEEP